MPTPQPGIFALGTRYHHYLEFDIRVDATNRSISDALQSLAEPHVSAGATNVVLAFGSQLWARLRSGEQSPRGSSSFTEVIGVDGRRAPATQHDIWVWTHGAGVDSVVDTAAIVAAALEPVASLRVDCSAFVYHDSRDLTGFIDGTANPTPTAAAVVACVPDGEAGAGGSHVLAQRWVHDLRAFAALSVEDQERVFGRTKLDSVELPAEARPATAHISLAEALDADGNERPIYRRSTPYGTLTERGLYFVGFSAEPDRFRQMLAQMYGTGGRQIRDRLLDFSVAVTGSFYFAPSIEDLLRLVVGDD